MHVSRTLELVWHVCLEGDAAEHSREWEREVALRAERDVPVARLQAVQGQDPLPDHLPCLLKHGDTQHRQVR